MPARGADGGTPVEGVPPAVVSIHDVGPDTLDPVAELLDGIRPRAGTAVSLLVVPGLDWSAADLDRLRAWQAEGFELAGHGWIHHGPPRTLWHRLHGWVISRDQAEHLSRSEGEIEALMRAGVEWFAAHDLGTPELYVPPAWALGAIGEAALRRLPYRRIEALQGFMVMNAGGAPAVAPCPLIGFEADTRFRAGALTVFNAASIRWARLRHRPLRIGFHPHDLSLRLRDAALASLDRGWRFLTSEEAVAELTEETLDAHRAD